MASRPFGFAVNGKVVKVFAPHGTPIEKALARARSHSHVWGAVGDRPSVYLVRKSTAFGFGTTLLLCTSTSYVASYCGQTETDSIGSWDFINFWHLVR